MALKVTCHEGEGYLPVEIIGLWETFDAKHAIDEIRDEADRRGQTRLFIDVHHVVPPESELTRFLTGEHAARCWPHPFKTAVVMTRELFNGFAETVAVNRGADFRVFFEREAALEWLCPRSNQTDADDGPAG
jgi:hypothetical protein